MKLTVALRRPQLIGRVSWTITNKGAKSMTHESMNRDNATSRNRIGVASIAATLLIGLLVGNQTA